MDETTIIHLRVELGEGATLGRFVEIGIPPGIDWGEDTATVIGEGATIRSHTVIYAGNRIGDGFQTGHHALVREHNTIGDNVSIGSGSVVEHHVIIGDGVRIHSQAFVPEYSVLEDGCWLGPNVVFTNDRYPNSRRSKANLIGPHIGKRARIGANSTILPGVRIGENALVGAGSVVTRDVPPGKVVAGNPARIIGEVAGLRRAEHPDEPVYE